jgi:hypothetical protein
MDKKTIIYIGTAFLALVIIIVVYLLFSQKIRADSPMNLYKITGGEANVWWNDTKVTGPDTINPATSEPFLKNHVHQITIKAKDKVPLNVTISSGVTYNKLRIHPTFGDLTTDATSRLPINTFSIDDNDNYYTLETVTVT